MSIEQDDQKAAAVAVGPRVTLEDINANIKYRFDFNAADAIGAVEGHIAESDGSSSYDSTKLLSVCILVLQNGFTIIGKSACAYPQNFNAELGREIAFNDARNQMWALMGYNLKENFFINQIRTVDKDG